MPEQNLFSHIYFDICFAKYFNVDERKIAANKTIGVTQLARFHSPKIDKYRYERNFCIASDFF